VDDLGNFGEGVQDLTDTDTYDITIVPVKDEPKLKLPFMETFVDEWGSFY